MKATADFYAYTTVSASSEDSGYPKENLKIYDSSTESFRSTVITEVTVVLDLLAAVAAPRIILYRTNFTSYKVQGNPTDSWGAPAWESNGGTPYTVEQDPDLGIYKHAIQLTGFNHKYMRIVIPAQTPIGGESFFEIGCLGLFVSLVDFSVYGAGFGLPVDSELVLPEDVIRFETNRKDIVPMAAIPTLQFSLSGNLIASVANRQNIRDVFGDVNKSIIYMDRTTENSWQAYIVQRTGSSLGIAETSPGNAGVRRYGVQLETIL